MLVHPTMKEDTAAEYAVHASIQIMVKAADKYEVAAAKILQQTRRGMFRPDWTEMADISSIAASALARLVEHEGFQRICDFKDQPASILFRDPVALKLLQDMSAVAYGTDDYLVNLSFISEGRKQDALKYGICITNFPTHHFLEKDNMWRLTLAICVVPWTQQRCLVNRLSSSTNLQDHTNPSRQQAGV